MVEDSFQNLLLVVRSNACYKINKIQLLNLFFIKYVNVVQPKYPCMQLFLSANTLKLGEAKIESLHPDIFILSPLFFDRIKILDLHSQIY